MATRSLVMFRLDLIFKLARSLIIIFPRNTISLETLMRYEQVFFHLKSLFWNLTSQFFEKGNLLTFQFPWVTKTHFFFKQKSEERM